MGEDASAEGDAANSGDAGANSDAASTETDAGFLPDVSMPSDGGFAQDSGIGVDASAPSPDKDPVLFIHGIKGSSTEFAVMIDRLVADGWPREILFTLDFADPDWGCNIDNADQIDARVAQILAETGRTRIDLVAHSMGALSSRYYLKNLGGTEEVNTYVTLGGLHHGNQAACLNPLPVCVWQELCPTHEFLTQLNDDPATPGDLYWVSIYSTDDGTVPVESSMLDGAENIEVSGVPHAGAGGLLEDEGVYQEVKRVLDYPPW